VLHGNHGSAAELFVYEGENVEHRPGAVRCASARPAEQNDARSVRSGERKQCSEVGVGGDDDAAVRSGSGEDLIVGGAAETQVGDSRRRCRLR
jgi:hypothetical protein